MTFDIVINFFDIMINVKNIFFDNNHNVIILYHPSARDIFG